MRKVTIAVRGFSGQKRRSGTPSLPPGTAAHGGKARFKLERWVPQRQPSC